MPTAATPFSFPPSIIPRSTTWTILQALDHLSPPTSDVSLDNLASMPSSGEIPIFLHGGIELSLSPSSSASSGSFEQADTSSQASFEAPGTAGTFGPMPTVSVKLPHDSADVDGAAERERPVCPKLMNFSAPVAAIRDAEFRMSIQDSPPVDNAGPATCRIPRSCSSPLLTENFRPSRNDYGEPLGPLSPSLHPCTDEEGQMLLMTPSQSLSTLPTPMFAPSSPALSMTPESSPDHRFASRLRTAVQKGVSYVAARHASDSPTSLHHATSSDSLPGSSVPKSRCRRRSGSSSTTQSDQSSHAAPTPVPPPGATTGPFSASKLDLLKFGLLPVSMAWLKEITVELFIDQEGFRAIRPAFKLVGYTGPLAAPDGAPPSLATHLSAGRADFLPPKRQSFVFHHATLDTPPVLRRVLVNGDETHDHTARQAYLPLKAPGAYSVRSGEPPAWRFDYLVGEHRAAGRAVLGERTFTPLGFSCAPALVHPAHGKKVRLMQVFRKSVVPKLTAERLEPAHPPRQPEPAHSGKGFLAGHRRVRSHALKQAETNVPAGGRAALQTSSSLHASLLRDGAAAGTPEHKMACARRMSGGAQMPNFKLTQDRGQRMSFGDAIPPVPPVPQPARHIVPNSVLVSMFAESTESHDAYYAPQWEMKPLSPPKHHSRRRPVTSSE